MTPLARQPVNRQRALAQDALRTVRGCPEHIPAWWKLMGYIEPLTAVHLAEMLDLVSQVDAATPIAQWHKHSALWSLSRQTVHLTEMANVAHLLPDPDRWMALAVLTWSHALAGAGDRVAFRKIFTDTRQAELMGALGQSLPPAKRRAGSRKAIRRVAIVASQLSMARHPGTDMVFDLRAALEHGGVSTHVFSAQEMILPTMSRYLAGANKSAAAPAQPSTWNLRTPGSVKVSLADAEFSIAMRWGDLLQMIDGFSPDLVLYVGFTSPLLWSLYPAYPVVGMSLHTTPPLAPVDVWLAADPTTNDDVFWPGLPPPQVTHFPFRFWPTAQPSGGAREMPGLPRDCVLLVTSGHRLHREMPPDWTAGVLTCMDQHPHVHWMLVGVGEAHPVGLTQKHPRLHCMAHQDDLAGCLRMADIYLNPPRMGGGTSVALAMNLGLPVLSVRGSDGGAKVGDMAVADTNVYMQRLAEWVADADLRAQAGAALQRKFRNELDISRPEASHRLIQACHEALACFERRQSETRTQNLHAE